MTSQSERMSVIMPGVYPVLKYDCPYCGVEPDEPCKTSTGGPLTRPHGRRWKEKAEHENQIKVKVSDVSRGAEREDEHR